MRKHLFTLFVLSALLLIPNTGKATDYTVGDNQTTSNNKYLPFSIASGFNDSFTQQLYLASELTAKGASAGNITAISFKYVGASSSTLTNSTRSSVEVWIRAVAISSFSGSYGYGPSYSDKSAGTKYFEGSVTLPTTANTWYTITLDEAFAWDGTSNIIVTINDKTNSQTHGFDRNHLVYSASNRGFYAAANNAAHDASNAYGIAVTRISYVPVITFTFEDSGSSIPVPTSPYVDNETTNSAVIHWTAAEGADSYSIRYRTSAGAYGEAIDVPGGGSVTSYTLSGLEDGITYYYQIRTNVGSDYSDWTDEVSFSTLVITHIHDGITFSKWISTTTMPTSGDYYLNDDVTYDFYEGGYLDLAGNLNLCLNGHTINLGTKSINVTNGHTMTLFDHVGGGKITGLVAGNVGSLTFKGVISVENGGTLVLREGEVENTKPADDPEYKSIAIASGGTLIISDEPVISGNDIDIFLAPTIPAKVITIESGKPLTNSTPYKVYKADGVITSGWEYMSGADPKDNFVSANPDKTVYYNGIEAALKTLLSLSESSNNSDIGSNDGQVVDVNLTRPLVASQYNTFCLPFEMSNAQLEEYFGVGYELWELTSSSFDGEVLSLVFSQVTSLVAGKPYMLKPAFDVSSVMSFEDVTIAKDLSNTETEYIDFKPVFAPTPLEGGNRNLLFLGSGNELFYPSTTANIKAFRAYFEVKGVSGAPKARIVKKEDAATGIQNTEHGIQTQKVLRNGEIFILRDGKTYNVLGIECK